MTQTARIRKLVFDHLKANISDIADISTEHPTITSGNKALVAVNSVRDSASGRYISQTVTNPEIMITCYHSSDLYLTKPDTGVFDRVIESMKLILPGCNYHKVSDRYIGFIDPTLLYTGFLVYRFYASE